MSRRVSLFLSTIWCPEALNRAFLQLKETTFGAENRKEEENRKKKKPKGCCDFFRFSNDSCFGKALARS